MSVLQVGGPSKQNSGGGTGGGMASIAEQAAQRAANRGRPPIAQTGATQSNRTVRVSGCSLWWVKRVVPAMQC